ncbi:hypothetical protein HanPI659440_Chr09g0342021 [Helianthus annuus]|nr:hypothetical protein HanPI659440_Chr09g0342021 [Helianthus annuus]
MQQKIVCVIVILIPTRFLCLSDQEDSTLLIGLSLILSRSKEIMGPAFDPFKIKSDDYKSAGVKKAIQQIRQGKYVEIQHS